MRKYWTSKKPFFKVVFLLAFLLLLFIITDLFRLKYPISISQETDWAIAIYEGDSPLNLVPAVGIKNPVIRGDDVTDIKAEYVADPFMISNDGRWYMFFEVMNALTKQGDIGYAESPDGLNWEYKKIVLDEPFHLSYPYVFNYDNQFYMIPESSRAGAIRLYRAEHFPDSWSFVSALIMGKFVDNSVFRIKDTWWMFTCGRPHLHDELRLFFSENLIGPWTEHPASPIIKQDPTIAQPGGRVLIMKDGTGIRFAHDDQTTYGKRVMAFFINNISRSSYSEKPYEKNPILWGQGKGWNRHGMHHVDAHEISPGQWLAAVDGYRKHLVIRIEY